MRKSIKKMFGVRVAATLISVLLLSGVTTVNILRVEEMRTANAEAEMVLSKAQAAEVAHYKWSVGLSNALYEGMEFTGSTDPTSCVLGKWLYGDAITEDEEIVKLQTEMEPLHKELHESAVHALELLETNPKEAQAYYQDTIQSTLTTLVGHLDGVVERGTMLSENSIEQMRSTILLMQLMCGICLVLALLCQVSLIQYVLRFVVKPLLSITSKSRILQEGRLDLHLDYQSEDELGDLALTLEKSVGLINSYVEDLNRIMEQLSQGNFDVHTSVPYVGDFRSIEESLDSLTSTLSVAISSICDAQRSVSGNAGQLSDSAQSLSQGATEQASAVEELSATLDELARNAEKNVESASEAQENARLTGEQVSISSHQMEEMVAAMDDISQASQQIGKIIATIENIAFQTNILALNAAVEAARAGSAGKGFAVVSDEVRNLAAKSDQAAKATKELIENSVNATERGNQIVGEVSETLKKTLELVTQSNSAIGVIADAIHNEALSIAQVNEGVSQISSVVQTNSASSQESAAVSSELFEQVHVLEAQTNKFKLKQ
ncbi:MAG: HAMP domain-containing protein [Lachnospiraceae bacterium]|jgi:methyl-accepting chemotaxis protein|nr:HAMP domain-containing protein [Lachnospiraceae bacterium]MCI9098950.1 HAMP domain-containing protein [Lachnospiraceae bacterium]